MTLGKQLHNFLEHVLKTWLTTHGKKWPTENKSHPVHPPNQHMQNMPKACVAHLAPSIASLDGSNIAGLFIVASHTHLQGEGGWKVSLGINFSVGNFVLLQGPLFSFIISYSQGFSLFI